MTKRKRKQVSFTVLSKDKIVQRQVEGTTQRVRNSTGQPFYTSTSYATDVTSEHRAIGNTHGNRTTPTGYQMYAVKVELKEFDFTWPRSETTHYRSFGTTRLDTSNYGVGDFRHWGLFPAGDLWLPDVPDSLVNQAITECKQKLSTSDFNLATSLAEARDAVHTISALLTSMAALVAKLARDPQARYVTINRFVYYKRDDNIRNYAPKATDPDKLTGKESRNLTAAAKKERQTLARRYAKMARDQARSKTGAYGPQLVPGWVPTDWRDPLAYGTRIKTRQRLKVRRKIKWRLNADELVSGAESAWLSAMYAILPLWLDFVAMAATGADALRKKDTLVIPLRVLDKAGKIPASTSSFQVSGKRRMGAECSLTYKVADPHKNLLASLGLLNPFAVWWELTPFSFVMDWLVPISNTLESLTADMGLDFVSGYTNTKSFCDITATGLLPGKSGNLPSARFRNVSQWRTSIVTTPIVGIYFKSPFSNIHAISAIALLGKQMR